jgi:type II secretory pathway pseudopilin PulG/endogenous inhibitor of DNA gyrase (YacG/DUF329 family)
MSQIIGILIVIAIVILVSGAFVVNIIRSIRLMKNAVNSKAIQAVAEAAEELMTGDAGNISIQLLSDSKPRSISDMTSVYAPAIARDFPDLNLQQLISSAENKLCSALYAISAGSDDSSGTVYPASEDSVSARPFSSEAKAGDNLFMGVTPDFAAQIKRQTDELAAEGKSEHFQKIKIHKTGINSYRKTSGTCEIILQTAIEYLHFINQNGIVVSGNRETTEQARYDISLLYIQDESKLPSSSTNTVGINCPNCGAPVSGLGRKICEYCGTAIQSIDMRIWRMNRFTSN